MIPGDHVRFFLHLGMRGLHRELSMRLHFPARTCFHVDLHAGSDHLHVTAVFDVGTVHSGLAATIALMLVHSFSRHLVFAHIARDPLHATLSRMFSTIFLFDLLKAVLTLVGIELAIVRQVVQHGTSWIL